MKFPKMKDMRHTLSVALVSSYKRSTHEKKKEELSSRSIQKRKQQEKKN